MKKIFFILAILLFLSCKERAKPDKSSYTFKLPQKTIYVKAFKYHGGRFTIFFSLDSLFLENSKDSIEYRTGAYPRIIVDASKNIYVDSNKLHGKILSIGKKHFNIELVSDSLFDSFFENNIQKYPYSFIVIDTKEYSISVNQLKIKKGDIYGGWQ